MGIASEGMLCSGDELHITSDAEGILILPPATPLGRAALRPVRRRRPGRGRQAEPRRRAVPDRPGARGRGGHRRRRSAGPRSPSRRAGGPVSDRLKVEVREPELCTRFVGRWISGAKIGPSPDWVQMRLQAAGMRPVSNVVDASNYVMLELGKPTHTFNGAAVQRRHDHRSPGDRRASGWKPSTTSSAT